MWYFLIAGFFAGFFAALLAIGGSLILVPTWLKFGVDKNYAGNSVPTMIFMSSVIAFTVAYLNHVLEHVSLAGLIFYFVFSFVCSAICRGKYLLNHRHIRLHRPKISNRVFSYIFNIVRSGVYIVSPCTLPDQ